MDFDDYQVAAERTSGAYGEGQSTDRQVLAALALAGEVGEFCNLIKKKAAHGHDVPLEDIADELGDILWYVAELCTAHGLSMSVVGMRNVTKLKKRYPEGFSEDASKNRSV